MTYLPDVQTWSEWGQIFTDVALWRPVITQICQEQGLALAQEVVAGYPGTCAVFVVDEAVVVKLYPPQVRQDYQRELAVYRLLDWPQLPRLLAAGVFHDRIDWPYLALEFRPGQPIREVFAQIAPQNRRALARELGGLLRQLHALPVAGLTAFNVDERAWQVRMAQYAARNLAKLEEMGFVPKATLVAWAQLLQSWRERPFPLCLINADLTEDHLLLVAEDGQWCISALIDWADADVNVPAYEWIALWYSLCGQDAAMFCELLHSYDPALVIDDAFRQQMLVYTLRHQFGAEIVQLVWPLDLAGCNCDSGRD
ncbi:MAG: aminoglycoside phosphotransferase family protein [Chloroflexota bacterium]